jgi:hypothetical protein
MPARGEFTKLGTTRTDLEAAWPARLAEAQSLHAAGHHAWAIATAVYALEIRLKVMICKKLDLEKLPRAFEIHDLDSLLLLAGLSQRIERRGALRVKFTWELIKREAEGLNDLRYGPASHWTAAQAADLLRALTDPTEGVLSWLSKQR